MRPEHGPCGAPPLIPTRAIRAELRGLSGLGDEFHEVGHELGACRDGRVGGHAVRAAVELNHSGPGLRGGDYACGSAPWAVGHDGGSQARVLEGQLPLQPGESPEETARVHSGQAPAGPPGDQDWGGTEGE